MKSTHLTNYNISPNSNSSLYKQSTTPSNESPVFIFQEDQTFIKTIDNCITNNIANSQYTISQLATDIHISERQLRRRIKKLLHTSPSEYFRKKRLHIAKKIMKERKYKTINQVARAVGYRDSWAFRKNYIKIIGEIPSDYQSKQTTQTTIKNNHQMSDFTA